MKPKDTQTTTIVPKETQPLVQLRKVKKSFGTFTALHSLNLDLYSGEILTLLGPSGCGKSTLLKILAGFERPTSGSLSLRGADMAAMPPERRPVNMVFQRYALFPHLDVYDNIAFGLRIKKTPEQEVRKKVLAMIELVKLDGMAERWITELSGGQCQRVALARALVNAPEVLLLDEPLAALDLKIRQHMLVELKSIQEQTGTTFVYVTHDQDEAMLLSDRIALMDHGRIDQLGTPDDLYFHPESLFAAKFLGEANILDGTVKEIGPGEVTIETPCAVIKGPKRQLEATSGDKVHIVLRPEAVTLLPSSKAPAEASNSASGTVVDILPIGARMFYTVRLPDNTEIRSQELRSASELTAHLGETVQVRWNPDATAIINR